MPTTTPVAAMQILTLAVTLSEAYKSALEQFNKSAKKAEAPDYPLQRTLDYGSDSDDSTMVPDMGFKKRKINIDLS